MHIHYNTILMIVSLDLVLSYSDVYLCEELSELRLLRGSFHSSWLLSSCLRFMLKSVGLTAKLAKNVKVFLLFNPVELRV